MLIELGPAAPFIALGVVALVFALFLLEIYPPEIVAIGGAALLLLLGIIDSGQVLAAVANPAPVTIAAMFVLSAALLRTGALEAASRRAQDLARQHPAVATTGFLAAAAVASAFMNNTPVVMVLIPVVIALSRDAGMAASRLLIPLSYMVILGGTCTLVGTSTNLLVDGLARDLGMAPFGMFEITPLGLIVAVVGGGFLALAGPYLLPNRPIVAAREIERAPRSYLIELFVPAESPLIGRKVTEIDALKAGDSRLVDVIRGDLSLRRGMDDVMLAAGDRIVLRSRDVEVMGFRDGKRSALSPAGLEPASTRNSVVIEVLVGPSARILGQTLGQLRWRRRYGVYPIALHREGANIESRLEAVRLAVGDTLLIDGAVEDLTRLTDDAGLTNLSVLAARAFRRDKAPIALGALAGVVVLSAFGVAPILTLALIAVAVVLLTGCVDSDEGFGAVDARLLILIVSMLAIGSALEKTGAMAMIVGWLAPLVTGLSPLVTLVIVYALTSFLTELITNNAVAVLMAPISAGLAVQLGYDPRPFVVAVMFGASASFATPIGYQTNTLVYAAGGYRFRDFLVIGVPMNLIVGAATCLTIPLLWPF